MNDKSSENKIANQEWCQRQHAMIANGGVWGVPRSGLVFERTVDGFRLQSLLPAGEDRSNMRAAKWREYQAQDFACIQRHMQAAGLECTDPRRLLEGGTQWTLENVP